MQGEFCLECCNGPRGCNCPCHVGQSTLPASNALAVEDQPTDMFGNGLAAINSFSTPYQPDSWKAVQRIKLHHELVVHAAVTVVNCAEWQGEDQAKYLTEAIAGLKTELGKLRYLHPREANHD